MNTPKTLKLLIIEDSEDDTFLLLRRLEQAGFSVTHRRVQHDPQYRDSLKNETWDMVIADYNVPGFNTFDAIDVLRESGQDIPFIIVSGSIGEEVAVEAMRRGAQDYIMKDNLTRLIPAIERELHEAGIRKAHHKSRFELDKSEQRYRTLVEQASDGIFLIDCHKRIKEVNPAAISLLESDKNAVLGRKFLDYLAGDEIPSILTAENPAENEMMLFEQRICTQSGRLIPVEISAKVIAGGYIQAFVRDITKRFLAEKALRESEERYALAALGANDGLWDWNLTSNRIYFSPRWKEMVGYGMDEIAHEPEEWFQRVHSQDRQALKEKLKAHLRGVTPHFQSEYRIKHRDGTYRWVLARGLAIRDKQGKALRIAGSQTDITDRKKYQEQIIHDAFHDPMTGLPNRSLFLDRLQHAIERLKRHAEKRFAVLLIDIDRFKVINESMGHVFGDRLLLDLAFILMDQIGPGDTLARLGGDEFAILLEEIPSIEECTTLATQILEAIRQPVTLEEREVTVNASIGIVTSNLAHESAEQYLRDADIAMYQAKSVGGASYMTFHSESHTRFREQLTFELDIRNALKHDQFVLYFQPVVALADERVVGCEALIRWRHPKRGLLSPGEFLPIAEEAGLLVEIDRWVIRKALQVLHELQREYCENGNQLNLSVNVSTKQFYQQDFLDYVTHNLSTFSTAKDTFCIEITEGTIMDRIDKVTPTLKKLKTMGVKIYIDDFGTGYSSLSYLHHFPLDVLKIDRSFIQHIHNQHSDHQIISTIITLGRQLGLKVMAEGVESLEHTILLKHLKCDYAQGFYYAKPMSIEALKTYLASKRTGNTGPDHPDPKVNYNLN